MKKIFGFLICALLISVRVYAEDDIPTDKSYTFDRANVASVLAEFIEDEKKAEKAADRYNELSNNSENAISAVDFVDVCVAGGMNMKLADGSGYMKCLDMFMKLIEMQNLDAGGFDMYCPATGNALKSITDKTQVGDICGGTPDTYIEYGHVTLKTDDKNGQHKYVCTCTPQSCKDGYYWNKEKYQCSVKDKEGYCVRHILGSFEYKNGKLPTDSGVGLNDWNKRNNAYYNDKYAQINASTDAFNRCVEYGANQGCRIRGALASADVGSGFGSAKKYQVICNPENYEIAADKKIQEDKEKKHKAELEQNTSYYEVCGKKDKGKGECIDDVFTRKIIGGTQVSYATGNALVKEYARVRLGDEITCGGDNYDKNIRKSGTEYFIKCKSLKDLTKYYEFKFDDLEESKDLTANASVYNAVWHIIYDYNIAKNSHNGYDTGTKANCDAVNTTFKKICNGCGTEWRESGYTETRGKKFCYDVINISDNTTCKKSPNDLNTAFDIDPFVFCKNTHNQLKNTGNLESLLKQYLSDKSGVATYNIECYPQTLCYTGSGCEGTIGHGDDIKTCVVHGNKDYTVDFVFDDVNEFSKKLSEVSMDAMQCVISGHELSVKLGVELNAKNKGKKCTGLTKELCTDLDKMIRNRGGSGAHYDNKKMACIINSAKEYSAQEFWTNMGISAVVAVGSAVMVIGSGGVATPLVVAGVTMAIETGINGSFYIVEELEDGQAGRRFTRFINAAKKCKDSTCAQNVIKNHYNDLASVKEDYNYEDAAELQKELDRLFGLMEGDFCWQDQNGNILNPDSNGKCDKLVAVIYLDKGDKSLQRAEIALIVGGVVYNPESTMMKVASKGNKLAHMSQQIRRVANAEKVVSPELKRMSYIEEPLNDFIKNGKNSIFSKWTFSDADITNINHELSMNNKGVKLTKMEDGRVTFVQDVDVTTQTKPKLPEKTNPKQIANAVDNLESEIDEFLRYLTNTLEYDVNEPFAYNLIQIDQKWGIVSNGKHWEQRIRLYEDKIIDIKRAFNNAPESSKIDELWETFNREQKIVEEAIEEYRGLIRELGNYEYQIDMLADDFEHVLIKWGLKQFYYDRSIDERIRFLSEKVTDIDSILRQFNVDGIDELWYSFRREEGIVEEMIGNYRRLLNDLEGAGYHIDMPYATNMQEIKRKWDLANFYDSNYSYSQQMRYLEEKMSEIENIWNNHIWYVDGAERYSDLSRGFQSECDVVKKEIENLRRRIDADAYQPYTY